MGTMRQRPRSRGGRLIACPLWLVWVGMLAALSASPALAQQQQQPPTEESAPKKAASIRASIAVAQLGRTEATEFLSGLNSQSATNKAILLDPPEARRQLELLRR